MSSDRLTVTLSSLARAIEAVHNYSGNIEEGAQTAAMIRARIYNTKGWGSRANNAINHLNMSSAHLRSVSQQTRYLSGRILVRMPLAAALSTLVGAPRLRKIAAALLHKMRPTGKPTKPAQSPKPALAALSQANPQGDQTMLDLKRPGGSTVRQEIATWGCLMTDYTMLLQAKGLNVTITDLYRANYEAQGGNFDEDAADGTLNNNQIWLNWSAIGTVAPDYNISSAHVSTATNEQFATSLKAILDQHGSVILEVVPGLPTHWIVIDGYNADGTYRVRDPLNGTSSNLRIGVTSGDYMVASSGVVQYLIP